MKYFLSLYFRSCFLLGQIGIDRRDRFKNCISVFRDRRFIIYRVLIFVGYKSRLKLCSSKIQAGL
ncbi:hypothetical protein DWV37_04305 [Tannerella sp. AF04-6]|nr:hypothetical protein DW107_09870 [Tannerella sp. AM09-19]RHS48161.1 hypothetical protein DWV37_04305 [Tannerella sp. AF04-6]